MHDREIIQNKFCIGETINALAGGLSDDDERRYLEEQLPGALQRGELSLYYQPQFQIEGLKLIGSEALLRWKHPKLDMISPSRFIPIAERTGWMVPLGTWVLQEACRQNRHWQEAGYDPIAVAVNVSAQQLVQVDFVSTISRVLRETGLEPRYLELELAETVLMRNIDESEQKIAALKRLGVGISMDDFGTGLSSLRDLLRLPVDTLKIDVSFVRNMHSEASTLRPVKAIVALGHSLSMTLMAEGVETESQLEQLRSLGCERAQGYLFGAAVSADDTTSYRPSATSISGEEEPA